MAIRKLISLVSLLALSFACSRQGEGERCSRVLNGDQDCETGLTCQSSNTESCGSPQASPYDCRPDRCCPPVGSSYSDPRCLGYTVPFVTTGTGGADAGANNETGGKSSTAGTGGGSSVGTSTGGTSSTDDGGVSDTGGTSAAST